MGILAMSLMALLFIWLFNSAYTRFWMRGLDVSLRFSGKTANEGDTAALFEAISNAKLLPLPWVGVKFQMSKHLVNVGVNSMISDDLYRNDLFTALPYQKITRKLPFVCAKRGFYTIKSIDVICSNLLHSRKMVMHAACSASLAVYPRLIPVDELPIPFKDLLGEAISKRAFPPDPFEFKGIREHQPYDSMKSINFKATARAGKLMSNVHEATSARNALLMLNLQAYSSWDIAGVHEEAIRVAASVAALLTEENVPVRFVTNGREVATGEAVDLRSGLGSSHLDSICDALAHVDLGKAPLPFSPDVRLHSTHNESDQIYILVSTYDGPDLAEEFQRLEDMGADAFWIIPVLKGMPTAVQTGGAIVKWEVQPGF